MMIIKKGFLLKLALKFPKKNVEVDFTNKMSEIKEAEDYYNDGHNCQEIKVIEVTPETITITFVQQYTGTQDSYIITNPGKSLAKFSQYLYHQCNFKDFSAQSNKLFKTVSMIELTPSSSKRYGYQFHKGFPLENELNENSNSLEITDFSDEALIDVVRCIVSTQNIGNSEAKKNAINKCKELLVAFV